MISISELKIQRVLEKIGIREGDTVIVHSSIGLMFGLQDNPAKLLYSALRRIITDSGTIAVPTFTFSTCKGAVFDIDKTPSEVGSFSNYILSLDGVRRSIHPILSIAAIGPNAKFLSNHESPSSFGEKSSYQKIIKQKAHVLLVGAGINYLSLIHQVEEDLSVPYRFYKEFDIQVKIEGFINEIKVPYYARYLDRGIEYDYEKREKTLIQSKAINTIRLGWGNIKYGRADEIYSVLYEKVLSDRLFLLKKYIYE